MSRVNVCSRSRRCDRYRTWLGKLSNAGLTHMGRKRRDVHGEPMPTETRPCLRCRKPFESEGSHHRLCGPCANRASETSPYAV